MLIGQVIEFRSLMKSFGVEENSVEYQKKAESILGLITRNRHEENNFTGKEFKKTDMKKLFNAQLRWYLTTNIIFYYATLFDYATYKLK